MKHLKDYDINEIIQYFEQHSELETIEHFGTSKSVLYRVLKSHNYKKPKNIIMKRRQETISKDPDFWQKRNKKTIITNLERYGETFFTKTQAYIEKAKKTNLEKYGAEWYFASEAGKTAKQEYANSLGVTNVFQSDEIKEKIKQTNLERRGVINPSQCSEVSQKKSTTWIKNALKNKHHYRCYVYNDIYFDSFPELAYYMKNLADGINISRCSNVYTYIFDGTIHKYFPDFVIDDTIIELKSPYLYNFMTKSGTVENAKLQCLLTNGVTIKLTNSKEILDCIAWFKEHYNKEDFKVTKQKEK